MGRPIWSVLNEELVMDLLTHIPLLNGGNVPEPFIRLSQILQEHPNVDTLHRSMDVEEPHQAAHQVAHTEETSTHNLRKRSVRTVNDRTPHVGEHQPAFKSRKKRPRTTSEGACCRNGVTVGLRESGLQQTSEEQQPCEDVAGERDENDMETDTGTVWLSNGKPPIPDDAAKLLFYHLAAINTTSQLSDLTTLLHDIFNCQLDDLSTYDLNYSSIIAQCNKVGTGKAIRDFRTALLYIRLAIHIDL